MVVKYINELYKTKTKTKTKIILVWRGERGSISKG